jgi:hypothetical protein
VNWAILDENKRVTSIVTSEIRPEGSVKVTEGSGAVVGYYWNGWSFDAPRWSSYDFLMLASSAHQIIADDSVTVAGMNYLVSASIITSSRKAEILS